MAPLVLAWTAAVSAARAESAAPEGGAPFFCRAASQVSATHALPRNAPAIPLNPSSLAGGASFILVESSDMIAAEAHTEYWNGFAMWLVVPASEPSAGDYQLHYDEECSVTDGGAYERRFHPVDFPYRFTDESRLPTVAGDLLIGQTLSNESPYFSQDYPDDGGACEYNAYRWMRVIVQWSMASEIRVFGEAVQAVSVLPDDKIGYRRNYGTIDAPGGLVTVFDGLINCNRWHASASGYVDGRGTYRLRSHLAGAAQDIPGITAEIQLACPPPELVGPCDDGGADAGEDAPEEDVTDGDVVVVPDVTVTDVITDVPTHADTVDVGRADAPRTPVDAPGRSDDAQGSADASSDAGSDGSGETKDVATSTPDSAGPNVDAAAPPSDDPDSDRGSCSCSAPGDARSRKQTGWLIGGLIGMGVAFRRKYARRGEG